MLGEEIVDERCWIVKTHYPMALPTQLPYFSNKIIVIVRNPLDVFPSLFGLASTASHSATFPFENHEEAPDQWDKYLRGMSQMHKQYWDVVLNRDLKNNKCPTYFMRFEDLLANKREQIEELFKFILDLDDLEGTNA
jgi:hypothetical protein